ncbi:hypothetical protein CBI38_36510 (plasmid) [Rhodococcus oxybenzonivorans]|uniref:Uncharacterized protein n=1 Tax=Rhodococcus oxybenzonivorans TaxID=1990687 RepID=A0A2S2C7S6_9NOCA|nr:hypothetical protein [Rhodococcus oxybenzonivorans]AWK76884.1 hypothetical protein CBI38_36510 [Rhodococcus oxybenzonivorans]
MLKNPDPKSDCLERYETLPPALQHREALTLIDPEPTQWITVLRRQGDGKNYSSLKPLLVATAHQDKVLATTDWSINDLGEPSYGTDRDPAFHDGLTSNPDGYDLHFFADALWLPTGTSHPLIEFTPSFRWWLGLVTRPDESMYRINDAGRDEEVVKVHRLQEGEYEVQVSARHLRKYLAARGMSLVVQHSHCRTVDTHQSDRIDLGLHTKVASFDYIAWGDSALGGYVATLTGKHVVLPFAAAGENPDDTNRPEKFQEFIVDVDSSTGEEIRLSCQREDSTYLTPVFFDSDVLTRYRERPSRYLVQRTSVACHGRWSMDIDINDEGLVQVWLGDLGSLPESEREYWLTHNVPPHGGITITRVLRDLAGRWVEDERPDPDRLRRARADLIVAFKDLFGDTLYRPLGASDATDFAALALCTNSTEGQRNQGIITLAIGIVEALDVKVLRQVSGADEQQSLNCLQQLVEKLGGNTSELMGPLRLLQGLRSSGAAHMKGSKFDETLARAGLTSMPPDKQFEEIVDRVTKALQGLTELCRTSRKD